MFRFLWEYFLNPGIQKETSEDHGEIYNNYRVFVNHILENYKHDFRNITSQHLLENLFEEFWKPFFDELLTELNRIYKLHRETMRNPTPFGNQLQKIAEQGLIDFKALTERYKQP